MKKTVSQKVLPALLLFGLVVIMLITVFTKAGDYGLTIDEKLQDDYGQSVLAWYKTLGKDQSFLSYKPSLYMPEHGGIFDAITAEAQAHFGHHWYTRAVMTGLAGFIGVIAIALCGYELGGWWFALLAALGLWLYPRYYGAIFNNPKDIPFTSIMTLVLWSVLVLINRWNYKYASLFFSILVGLFLGLAVAIRVVGVLWYPMLFLVLVGWWLLQSKRAFREKQVLLAMMKQMVVVSIILAVSFVTILFTWPYIFLSPFQHLLESIQVMQKYPWDGAVLFEGKMQLAVNLPRRYTLVWLVIGSPPMLLLFSSIGLCFVCWWLFRKRICDTKIAVTVLALFIPLGAIIRLHSTLYNGPRQFLFLIPPIVLLAVFGFLSSCKILLQWKQKVMMVGLVLVVLGSYLLVIKDMRAIYPYEYAYFSPFIGGVHGAEGKFEIDYWATCFKPSGEWLARNYQKYTTKKDPSVFAFGWGFLYTLYLPNTFTINNDFPDFYLASPTLGYEKKYAHYQLIHTESIDGVPLCQVYSKP